MAEVRVSVDDDGAARGVEAAGEHQEISAAGTPYVPGEQLPPLPPPPSPAPALGETPHGSPPRREAPVTRPILPDEWVHEDDYWQTQSLIAVSGRTAVPRPKPRSLKPPQRFRPVRRWQSMTALIILSAVILVACVAMLRAAGFANNLLHQQTPVPTVTHPSGSPTLAPSPTTKPHR